MPGAEIGEIVYKYLDYNEIILLSRGFYGIGEIVRVDFFYIM